MAETLAVELDREALDALNQERRGLSIGQEIGAIVRQQLCPAGRTPDWIGRARPARSMAPPGSIHVESWKPFHASRSVPAEPWGLEPRTRGWDPSPGPESWTRVLDPSLGPEPWTRASDH